MYRRQGFSYWDVGVLDGLLWFDGEWGVDLPECFIVVFVSLM